MPNIADKWAPGVSPEASIAKVAVGALNGRLDAVLHYLPLAALHHHVDSEYVHQLRVWTRRATAALSLYEDIIPERLFAWFRKELRRIRRAANDARDADVVIGRLNNENQNGTLAWLNAVRADRTTAQDEIVRVYEHLRRKQRLERKVEKLLEHIAARGQRPGGRKPFEKWARSNLKREVKRFFAAVPTNHADDTALHRFRIRAKALRYTIELLAGAFPPTLKARIYPIIESIQDRLGNINDHATAKTRLKKEAAGTTDRAQAANWKGLHDREHASLEKAKRAYWRWCTPARLEQLQAKFTKLLQPASKQPRRQS